MYVVHVWMLTTPATANINTFHMQYVIVEPANLLLAYGVSVAGEAVAGDK